MKFCSNMKKKFLSQIQKFILQTLKKESNKTKTFQYLQQSKVKLQQQQNGENIKRIVKKTKNELNMKIFCAKKGSLKKTEI